MGKIVYLMGKSSSGKDTIFKELMKEGTMDLRTIVPYTTRPIRAGEENGVEYFFTDETGFQTLREQGKVIEDRAYNTVYGIWRYFTVDDGQIDLDHKRIIKLLEYCNIPPDAIDRIISSVLYDLSLFPQGLKTGLICEKIFHTVLFPGPDRSCRIRHDGPKIHRALFHQFFKYGVFSGGTFPHEIYYFSHTLSFPLFYSHGICIPFYDRLITRSFIPLLPRGSYRSYLPHLGVHLR